MNIKTAFIPLGGKGTRLKSLTNNTPKALFSINGKNTFERAVDNLIEAGIDNIVISLNYKKKEFENELRRLEKFKKVKFFLFLESEPQGECGALWDVKKYLSDSFLFLIGDLIFSIDFVRLFDFHKRLNSNLTLVTHTCMHPEDSDLVGASNGSQIDFIYRKSDPKIESDYPYLGNAGIAVINKKILEGIGKPNSLNNSSLFHHLVYKALRNNERIFSYNTTEYIKDMGTEKRFKLVEKDLKNGIVYKKNYKFKQKALFLDRDNTIISCKEKSYITNPSELIYLTDQIIKLSKLSENFDIVCMVTNQPQIAMGKITIPELDRLNSKIVKFCLSKGLKIDIITFCPHHPHAGFKEEISELKTDCFCRKPNPGLIIEQTFLRNIDISKSLFVGDMESDKEAAKNAGCDFMNILEL